MLKEIKTITSSETQIIIADKGGEMAAVIKKKAWDAWRGKLVVGNCIVLRDVRILMLLQCMVNMANRDFISARFICQMAAPSRYIFPPRISSAASRPTTLFPQSPPPSPQAMTHPANPVNAKHKTARPKEVKLWTNF